MELTVGLLKATIAELATVRYDMAIMQGKSKETAMQQALSTVDRFVENGKFPEGQVIREEIEKALRAASQ
ncbi:hypothetical protein DM785_02095 [Deinococcus actinosclerus]|nr:hypothetical protein DM785_02095 [Deinococcus actinosclerus]